MNKCGATLISLTLVSMLSGIGVSAQISTGQINKLVASASGKNSFGSIVSRRLNEQVLVEIRGADFNKLGSLKQQAFAIGRSIMHADPGYVRGVITRFYDESGSSLDLMVTGKDLVSVEAGIDSRDKVIGNIPVVLLPSGSSGRVRFMGYSKQAIKLLSESELYAAWTFFRWAESQDRTSARLDGSYLNGLFRLGRAFDLRGDLNQADDVYDHLLGLIGGESDSQSSGAKLRLEALRKIASYFVGQGQFEKALKAASLLTRQQDERPFGHRKNYVSDVRLQSLCYRKLGRVMDARRELEGILLLSRNKKGENNPDVALILEDLGDCYSTEGNSRLALDFYTRAKRKYDNSMAARQSNLRLDYEIYQSAMKRLKKKMNGLKSI